MNKCIKEMPQQMEAEKSLNKCTLSDTKLPVNGYFALVWKDEKCWIVVMVAKM